jgi:tetratricopeptide (TPR) repeat protein
VSIDNLGVSIWGWVLGGSIVGLSTSSSEHVSVSKQKDLTNKTNIHGARILVSGVTNVLAVILIALLYTGEANAYKAMGTYDLENPEAKEIYRDINLNVLESVLTDPAYKLISANNLIQVGFTKDGLTAIESILRNDPRNLDALHSLSNLSAQLEDPTSAIKYRKIIAELDPWNAKNYLVLGQLYKVQDDSINCKLMLDKILSFAPNLPIAEQAKIELAF